MFYFSCLSRAHDYSYLCGMIKAIEQWISDPGREYAVGVDLLEGVCNNASLIRFFRNRSPRFAMGDLIAELQHWKKNVKVAEPATDTVAASVIQTATPSVVDEAKRIVHESWVRLSRIHRNMFDTGEGNGKMALAMRRRMMMEREPLIERYNSCYEAKEAFFAGTISEDQLRQVVEGKTFEEVKHPKQTKEDKPLQSMSDLQVAKKIKAAKAAINRCKNKLMYQQETAAKKENPMPDCPKRKDLEKKLADKRAELETLEAELKRREA